MTKRNRRPGDYESHALTTQPRKLNRHQTLATTNKAENRCNAISNATIKFPNKWTFLMNIFICEIG